LPRRCSAKRAPSRAAPAVVARLAAGWRKATTRICACCSRSALAEGEETEAAAGDAAGKKRASQQITIDQVRALDEFLHVGTHRHGARVVLLNPAEAMNRATANAILKALEEPIPGTLFILVSSEPHRLLPTIRSRCQTIPMRPPPAASAIAWLRHAGVRDGEQWLALAGGSPLLALELSAKGERALLDSLLGQVSRMAKASTPCWRRPLSTRR
jgi:DNA polymerase-3 subunit delta'